MATMTRGNRKQNIATNSTNGTPGTPVADNGSSLQELLMDIRKDLGGLKAVVNDMAQQLKENKDQLKIIGDQMNSALTSIEKIDKRVNSLESREKKFENEMLKQEMEAASHILRVQNVTQQPNENLQEIAADILSSIVNLSTLEIVKELDFVYRTHNSYTRRVNHPPELVIKLYRRFFRDSVLSSLGASEAEYKGNKLRILREVPWRLRQNRRQYKFFTTILKERGIEFKWLVPEGLQLLWEGKWIKIESITKLQKFVNANVDKMGLTDKLKDLEEEMQKWKKED